MKGIVGILLFNFFLSCSGSKKNDVKSELVEEQPIVESPAVKVDVDPTYLITSKKVGNFWIGMDLLEVRAKYEVRELEKQVEEGNIEIQYLVDNDHIALERRYDYDAEEYTSEVGNIYVQGGDYMTDRGIGVGASLADFVKCYPNYRLAFSYISYGFWIESGEAEGIQFFLDLDLDNFKNKDVDLFGGDFVELDYKDFDPNVKIKSIRVY